MTQTTPNPSSNPGQDAINLRQLVRFRIGQSLTEANALPAQVFVLLQGECRLLGNEQGRLATLVRSRSRHIYWPGLAAAGRPLRIRHGSHRDRGCGHPRPADRGALHQ